jgi:RimJ/RimL family protein N-acetyltransferase
LGAEVPAFWTEFGNEPLEYSLGRIRQHPDEMGWWTWLPIHKTERVLMGSGGFKGKHGTDGVLEIGYEITPHYRGQGYAQEMALALVQHAFSFPETKKLIAHTLPENNPSTTILTRIGFERTEKLLDPDDGPIWLWELPRK